MGRNPCSPNICDTSGSLAVDTVLPAGQTSSAESDAWLQLTRQHFGDDVMAARGERLSLTMPGEVAACL